MITFYKMRIGVYEAADLHLQRPRGLSRSVGGGGFDRGDYGAAGRCVACSAPLIPVGDTLTPDMRHAYIAVDGHVTYQCALAETP